MASDMKFTSGELRRNKISLAFLIFILALMPLFAACASERAAPIITEVGKNLATREMTGGGYPEILDAAITQDEYEVSLALIVSTETHETRAKELGFTFVCALIEYELEGGCLEQKRPYPNWKTKEIGEGIFDYLITVCAPDETIIAQGAKARNATHITW